jgi:hypothetical protein
MIGPRLQRHSMGSAPKFVWHLSMGLVVSSVALQLVADQVDEADVSIPALDEWTRVDRDSYWRRYTVLDMHERRAMSISK